MVPAVTAAAKMHSLANVIESKGLFISQQLNLLQCWFAVLNTCVLQRLFTLVVVVVVVVVERTD